MVTKDNELKKCQLFLTKNIGISDDGLVFNSDIISIELIYEDNSIVFIDASGDFLHIPLNYYALIGALIEYRLISINYESIK